MRKFGIYLCYPPKVELRAEGLGRYLAEFLREARHHTEVRFVIACPSWMRDSLREVLESAHIAPDTFEIIGPKNIPVFLRLHGWYEAYRRGPRKRRFAQLLASFSRFTRSIAEWFARKLVTTRSLGLVAFVAIPALPLMVFGYVIRLFARLLWQTVALGASHSLVRRVRTKVLQLAVPLTTLRPQDDILTRRLYDFMEESEANLMCREINRQDDIAAWYAPTAFWPHFNNISAPRLTCVPDVVLNQFPVGFSSGGRERTLDVFRLVEKTIRNGDRFVTYSHDVKQRTLVARYGLSPEATTVIPHGAHSLNEAISVAGFGDDGQATDAFCKSLFDEALGKAIGTTNAKRFATGDVRFLFYASQFRPNKNVLSLLKAYDHLLRRRFTGHKLVLTGNPHQLPEIAEFIRRHDLQNDVLCLHGLTDRQLAACYRLADLAVNPSLSEGGCPFTLTEALSVGTPVVMARIAVTEEVVSDPDLQDLMLFDPYDWKDMAQRIDWALNNKDELLKRQSVLYETLSKRSWRDVVDEHIALLDQIAKRDDPSRATDGNRVLPT
ncbi:glycosyltransferase [Bradyrhizobium sp. HKCCYLS2038]|uniref:glycosyltransferase n=1 Tax=unclassified Bradyrhizobium TaxID=2631580 RepID=UPI003EBB0AD1